MQIKVKNLSHTFDTGQITEHVALKNANVTINDGEYISVIGQTGSGKTTFIEHLNALLLPTDGRVELDDVELIKKKMKVIPLPKENEKRAKVIARNKKIKAKYIKKYGTEPKYKDFIIENSKKKIKNIKSVRKHVGIVFQFSEYQLFEETVEKDIIFGPTTMGTSKAKALELAKKYIKLVGLDESYLSKSPFSLSGGQKRRVALAGILAMEPQLLIFDEPTAGLDPQGEIETYKIFEKLHEAGKTIIIVTHNLDHALQYTDRTIMFMDGKKHFDGESKEILYNQKLLEDNFLEVPKLVDLVHTLESKGKKIGKVRSIDQLADKLNKGA